MTVKYDFAAFRKKAESGRMDDKEFKKNADIIFKMVYNCDEDRFAEIFGKDKNMLSNFKWLSEKVYHYGPDEYTDFCFEGENTLTDVFNKVKSNAISFWKVKREGIYKEKIQGAGKILEPETLLDTLKKGDSYFRGSSDEYKDIEESLKALSNIMKEANKKLDKGTYQKLVRTCMKSILDKADRFISRREDFEMENRAGTYSGKRIIYMREVSAALKAQIDMLPNTPLDELKKLGSYGKYIKKMFESTDFSPCLYGEVLNFREKSQYDDGYTVSSDEELMYPEVMNALEEGLGSKRITLAKADELMQTVMDIDTRIYQDGLDPGTYKAKTGIRSLNKAITHMSPPTLDMLKRAEKLMYSKYRTTEDYETTFI